jgi:hypothetical protein
VNLAPANCGEMTKPDYGVQKLRSVKNGSFASFFGNPEEAAIAPVCLGIQVQNSLLSSSTPFPLSFSKPHSNNNNNNDKKIPVMEGYLYKKTTGQSWNLRYFRILQDKLFYFQSHEGLCSAFLDSFCFKRKR